MFSDINYKPLDSAEFFPIYEKMQQYDLPIFIHPQKESPEPDYPGEQGSKYYLTALIGWPHATSMAMLRLASGGVLEKYPKLKLVTHHSGGTVPYLAGRIGHSPVKPDNLSGTVVDSLRLFYNDTAVQGNTANLMCAYAFSGAEHMLFGTDFPMAGPDLVRETIGSIRKMSITEMEKQHIFEDNARKLLKL
jgi:aminocarboxymuconate-semialdehyde decarboxylase